LKNLKNFYQFVIEQEDSSKIETDAQVKSRIAKALVGSLFGADVSTAGVDAMIDDTKETKGSLPYRGCSRSTPYQISNKELPVSFFSGVMDNLQKKQNLDYSMALEDLKGKKSIIVGIRNKLSVKKSEGDAFCDVLYFIPENANPTDMISPYQITTCPSLSYYGDKPLSASGTAIKAPGDSLYILANHKLEHGTYKMFLEGEPTKFYRYNKGIKQFDTYKPGQLQQEYIGLLIHRSSSSKGVCVGPWSGGCQVFDEKSKFDEFIKKAEAQSSNQGRFYYALIELDSISDDDFSKLSKGEDLVASAEGTDVKDQGDKKEKRAKKKIKKSKPEEKGFVAKTKEFFGFSS